MRREKSHRLALGISRPYPLVPTIEVANQHSTNNELLMTDDSHDTLDVVTGNTRNHSSEQMYKEFCSRFQNNFLTL